MKIDDLDQITSDEFHQRLKERAKNGGFIGIEYLESKRKLRARLRAYEKLNSKVIFRVDRPGSCFYWQTQFLVISFRPLGAWRAISKDFAITALTEDDWIVYRLSFAGGRYLEDL